MQRTIRGASPSLAVHFIRRWKILAPSISLLRISCTQLLESALQKGGIAYNCERVSVPRSTFYTQMINSLVVDLAAAYKLYATPQKRTSEAQCSVQSVARLRPSQYILYADGKFSSRRSRCCV